MPPPPELLRESQTSVAMGQSDIGQETEEASLGGSAGVVEETIAEKGGTTSDELATTKPGGKATKEAEGAFMVFDRGPVSVEAKALVGVLVEMIEARGQGQRERARRKRVQDNLVKLVGQFAGELVAAVDRETLPRLPCPKGSNYLLKLGIRYTVFPVVFDGLESLGLIRTEIAGSNDRWPTVEEALAGDLSDYFVADASLIGRGRGRVTRIRPTQALLALVRQHGIKPYSAWRHFPRLSPPEPLQLREGSRWVYGEKLRGNLMRFPETPEADLLKAEVQELNDFIRR